MIKAKTIFIIFLSILAISLFGLVSKAKAQTLSLSIWPPLLEVTLQPGKSITQVYKLANNGQADLVITSSILPFKPEGEDGNIKLTNEASPALEWFSFQNANLDLGQSFSLPAGKEQEAVLRIKAPLEAQEKDYYFTLLFSTNPDLNRGQFQPQSQAQAKIGSNILLTVSQSGQSQKKAQIIEFSLKNGLLPKSSKWQIIDSFNKPEFILRIKNTGQSLFKPMGSITTNWLGRKYILDLLPDNILIDSVRQAGCKNPQKENLFICQLDSKFSLGYYHTRVEFDLDKPGSQYSKDLYFFAIPLKLILTTIIIISLVFVLKKKFKLGIEKYFKKVKNK